MADCVNIANQTLHIIAVGLRIKYGGEYGNHVPDV